MEKEQFEYVNKFTFKNAKVIGIHQRGQSHVLTLLIKEGGRTLFPRIICRKGVGKLDYFQHGTYVDGEGYIRAYTEITKDNETKKHQYFVAENIGLSQDIMTELFGQKGKFFGKSYFIIALSGRAKQVRDIGEYSYLTVETDISVEGRKPSYVTVTKPGNVTKPNEDDMIALAVSLTTPKVVKEGQIKYVENLYVSDLVIV